MLNNRTKIYVVGKGFIDTDLVSPGDMVYALGSDLKPCIEPVLSISSEFIYQKINIVDSGQHNIDTTDDTRFLYYSDLYGAKYLKFSEIPKHTQDKAYSESKYLPVLSTPFLAGERRHSNSELEYIARMLAVEDYDIASFKSIVDNCTGEDALALVDMLEFWLSSDPGTGWFGRVQVKARAHKIKNQYIAYEIARIAVMAGFTSRISVDPASDSWFIRISYESRPIAGSRPKIEKYKTANYFGNVYLINARNKAILGLSKNRCFYLAATSTLSV